MIRDLGIVFLVFTATAIVVVLLNEVVPQINKPDPRIAECGARGGAWLHRELACVAAPARKAAP